MAAVGAVKVGMIGRSEMRSRGVGHVLATPQGHRLEGWRITIVHGRSTIAKLSNFAEVHS